MRERDKIVAWLRRQAEPLSIVGDKRHILLRVADDIENFEHLKRPEPTIPFEVWKDKPSVGH